MKCPLLALSGHPKLRRKFSEGELKGQSENQQRENKANQ